MRIFVLILMIALLPLRTWAAEGMAVRMAHGQIGAVQMADSGTMPGDCPMMVRGDAHSSGDSETTAGAQCTSCHLCAVAACTPQLERAAGPAPARAPERPTSRYLSAHLTPDLRPPIS